MGDLKVCKGAEIDARRKIREAGRYCCALVRLNIGEGKRPGSGTGT
jgi:hypothetical protein